MKSLPGCAALPHGRTPVLKEGASNTVSHVKSNGYPAACGGELHSVFIAISIGLHDMCYEVQPD